MAYLCGRLHGIANVKMDVQNSSSSEVAAFRQTDRLGVAAMLDRLQNPVR